MSINIKYLCVVILPAFFLTTGEHALRAQDQGSSKFTHLASENIRMEKGLSQNWIYCMIQDSYGYIWFGTWEGLNKFDGYDFTIFSENEGLSDHTIYSILEDSEGILWIGTDKGFNRFDRKTYTFTRYFHDPGDTASLVNNRVNHIMESASGHIWIGTAGGLSRMNRDKNGFTSFFRGNQNYNSPRSNYILHLSEDENGHIWISTTYGLIKFDPENRRSTRYYHITGDDNSLSDNNVRCLVPDAKGNFWIGTTNGLNFYDVSQKTIKRYFHDPDNQNSLSDNWIRALLIDRSGQLWIGTNNGGLNRLDPSTGDFTHFRYEHNRDHSLSNDRVYSILEDHIGNIWAGTFNGVNRLGKYSNDFTHIYKLSDDGSGLRNNIVWAFEEDPSGNLWIGTSGGVSIFDPGTGRFSHIFKRQGKKNNLIDNDVRVIRHSPQLNSFWLGTYGSGLEKYDPATGKHTYYLNNPNENSIASNYINDILIDSLGNHWFATGNGLSRLDASTGTFTSYRNIPGNEKSLSNNIVICLLDDGNGYLWIGTDYGLNRFHMESGECRRYLHDPDNPNSISHNTVFALHKDAKGNIWAGTSGGGLNMFQNDLGSFTSYTTEDGLPNNIIYGILEDGEANLWISTNQGLAKFYPASGNFVTYDINDGIQSNEFNLGACYKSSDGTFYFGGMNGYNLFKPEDIRFNPVEPVIVITAFKKFNETQPGEYYNGDTIRLSHDDNFFAFEFSALDYTNPAKNRYRYKLENIDEEWIYTTADNRLAEYKKVSPGSYLFRVNGTNNDGIWNQEGVSLSVMIRPPWYQTWAFRILFGLFVVSMIWFLIYNRIRKIKRKSEVERKMLEIEKQMFDLEQKALRLQMNPHFIFNSLNSVQSYILAHDSETAINYLGKFSRLMRFILANSASKVITVKEEISAIKHYLDLEKLRFDDKFDYRISIDPGIDEDFTEIPPMILQPYVENSVIHGMVHKRGKGIITIGISRNEDYIYCTIEDDGVGREKAMELARDKGLKKTSRGMLITQARLDILKRQSKSDVSVKVLDLKDASGNATGTRVVLKIPFSEA